MVDTAIKGTGNSRSIKTVPNIKSMVGSLDDLLDLLIAGFPVDLGPLNAAGVQVMGTALTKANLLTDAAEKAIWGNAANRTPNQALQQLRALITTAQSTAEGRTKIATGSYVGTGSTGSSGPTEIILPFSASILFVAEGVNGNNTFGINVKDSGRMNAYYAQKFNECPCTWNGTSVGWYYPRPQDIGSSAEIAQLNIIGSTYYYVAMV